MVRNHNPLRLAPALLLIFAALVLVGVGIGGTPSGPWPAVIWLALIVVSAAIAVEYGRREYPR